MKLLLAFACGVLLYILQNYLYRRFWDTGLTVTVTFKDEAVREGNSSVLVETIRNQKWLPLPVLQIKFAITRTFLFKKQSNTAVTDQYYRNEFFSILPYQKITRTYPFVCSRRGCFRMTDMDIICKNFFMTGMMLKNMRHPSMIYVLPKRIDQLNITTKAQHLLGEIVKNVHQNEDPFEFAGIREYQPFDSMHSINWKSTARLGKLQVNTFRTTFSKKVVLLLNIECNAVSHAERIREEAVRITATLADLFAREKIPVAYNTNGKDLVTKEACRMEAGSDMIHVRNIEVALARLDMEQRPESFLELLEECVKPEQSPVEYIVISNYRKKNLCDKIIALRDKGYAVCFVIPELKSVDADAVWQDIDKAVKWTVNDDY